MLLIRRNKVNQFCTRGTKKEYDIMDIAIFIVNYCAETKRPISNLYLQKLLYFVHAFFLVETKEQKPLFNSKMEAWAYGPAFPEVYYSFDSYICDKIPYQDSYSHFSSLQKIQYNKYNIDTRDREIIMYIIDKYRDRSLADIVFYTQNQTPWSEAYGLYGNNRSKTISNDAIKNYFMIHRQY